MRVQPCALATHGLYSTGACELLALILSKLGLLQCKKWFCESVLP